MNKYSDPKENICNLFTEIDGCESYKACFISSLLLHNSTVYIQHTPGVMCDEHIYIYICPCRVSLTLYTQILASPLSVCQILIDYGTV